MSAQLSFEDNLLATRRRETQRWRVAYYTENAPEVDDATYDAAIAKFKTETHRFVRHQYTSFRKMPDVVWFDLKAISQMSIYDHVAAFLRPYE